MDLFAFDLRGGLVSFESLAVDLDLYGQRGRPLEILPGLGAGQSLPIQVVGLLVCP